MGKHVIRFFLALHLALFFIGALHLLAAGVYITDFGDVERFAALMDEWSITLIAWVISIASAATYAWLFRKKPLWWNKGK